jgi:hypothetical protein
MSVLLGGIDAKQSGAHELFLEANHIAIDWPAAGDLGRVGMSGDDY